VSDRTVWQSALEPSAARFVETVEAERAGRRLNLPSLQHGGPRYPTACRGSPGRSRLSRQSSADLGSALVQWRPAYKRGFALQAPTIQNGVGAQFEATPSLNEAALNFVPISDH
jgi:hypothetical protein